ncbi:uncharacterized protein LOC112589870 [Harpegnathos saltator]|uniref:uncharacterized protein LOC112589870 n=1 Tax=Harpegnathos saltator TaxID=610380 RepID=UPI000DBED9B1|nr:uncharacterized protein LOC112589870 [Harpegnathos saltator]
MKLMFFTCDEFDKAFKKLKECEEVSDLQSTEVEDDVQSKKRKRKPNLKYIISSEDEYDENCDSLQLLAKLDKPVQLKNGPWKVQRRDCVLQEIPTSSSASYTNNDASIIAPTINTRTKVTNSTLINKNENNSTTNITIHNSTTNITTIKLYEADCRKMYRSVIA